MKVELKRPSWYSDDPTDEAIEALSLLKGIWSEAATRFATIRSVQESKGKITTFGIQKYLNEIIDERFPENNWEGKNSRYRKGDTWVRITFRHQMSVGAELFDVIKMTGKENIKQSLLLAASNDFLKVISPRDAGSLTSFEKLAQEMGYLAGTTEVPLILGCLTPISPLTGSVHELVYGPRLRGE
jgi:hypothetical protein